VHGDLLGQNILLGVDDRDAVIDWEYAQFGDPAYDLAIVTRGVWRPFQIEKGMERLLEAYAKAGGAEVTRAHVNLTSWRWWRVGTRTRRAVRARTRLRTSSSCSAASLGERGSEGSPC
jgi:aminoglycoside phosphotransferase (APT) family kinase protein